MQESESAVDKREKSNFFVIYEYKRISQSRPKWQIVKKIEEILLHNGFLFSARQRTEIKRTKQLHALFERTVTFGEQNVNFCLYR